MLCDLLELQVCAGVMTCGGLCPGLNNVIRQVVLDLYQLYGIKTVYGIRYDKLFTPPEYSIVQLEVCTGIKSLAVLVHLTRM